MAGSEGNIVNSTFRNQMTENRIASANNFNRTTNVNPISLPARPTGLGQPQFQSPPPQVLQPSDQGQLEQNHGNRSGSFPQNLSTHNPRSNQPTNLAHLRTGNSNRPSNLTQQISPPQHPSNSHANHQVDQTQNHVIQNPPQQHMQSVQSVQPPSVQPIQTSNQPMETAQDVMIDERIRQLAEEVEKTKRENQELEARERKRNEEIKGAQKEVEKLQEQLKFTQHEADDAARALLENQAKEKNLKTKPIRLPTGNGASGNSGSPIKDGQKKRNPIVIEVKEDAPPKKQKTNSPPTVPTGPMSPVKDAIISSREVEENEMLKKNVAVLKKRLKAVKKAISGEFDREKDVVELVRAEIRKQSEFHGKFASQDETKKLLAEIENLKKQLEMENAKTASAEVHVLDTNRRMDALKQEYDHVHQNLVDVFAKMSSVEEELRKEKIQNANLNSRCSDSEEKREILELKLKDMEKKYSERKTSSSQERREIENMRNENRNLRDKIEQLENLQKIRSEGHYFHIENS
eukprot:TRINITY_DN8647_c0_g1_i1.p2 TRINITY_DN8647_c0_g1~~TRINITY_DN8647_c0_g1_i1.p2  ORF type:complete len:519 (+),score=183.42 TRINITY_DN8647_c0_g1_i1:31-1587(+)